MRGSLTYHDLMYKITREDLQIMNGIIKENIAVSYTNMTLPTNREV